MLNARNETAKRTTLPKCEELSQQDMQRIEGGGRVIVCDELVVKGQRPTK
jgi:hypothetical protein